jgi:hypothetical protein
MIRRASVALLTIAVLGAAHAAAAASDRSLSWCGTARHGARDAVWAHRERVERAGPSRTSAGGASEDVGEVAVILDQGDLAFFRNPMDLQQAGLLFAPSGDGYQVTRADRPVDAPGTPLSLGDDDSRPVELPFPFLFYGQEYRQVFVNSDGNLTFVQADAASTARNVGRLVSGPPRIAPLLADFDPTSGGTVTTTSSADRFTVTWTDVPQWSVPDKNTFEVSLRKDGGIELSYGSDLSAGIKEGVVGVAPGNGAGGLTAVDLSAAAGAESAGALGESFRQDDSLDTVAVARRFYASHPDDYAYLVVFTNRGLTDRGTFAYEQTVKNLDRGTGDDVYDLSGQYGSAGRLESFVLMDAVGKYPEDLELKFLGEDSGLAVLAHECGHRWLAQATFKDGDNVSQELLGRDGVHWSFFMDTDASHLEGNDIEDLGANHFKTVGAGLRYSPLDQYLMGLRADTEVPPFFFVRNPFDTGNTDVGRDPTTGVTFSGTRRDVTVEDVIAALGPRQPPVGQAPNAFRQAFILVSVGGPPDAAAIAKVERFRQAWPDYFARSIEGRATMTTNLH